MRILYLDLYFIFQINCAEFIELNSWNLRKFFYFWDEGVYSTSDYELMDLLQKHENL